MAADEEIVRVRNVHKYFTRGSERVDVLQDLSLNVPEGEVVALLGPSGSGKTTLLNAIGCIMEPSSGVMVLEGETVYDGRWLRDDLRRLRLDKIGFIFQFHNLLPFLDATENVALVLKLAGADASAARAKALELLDYLEVGHRKTAFPAKLSGGEAQRVAIARALAPDLDYLNVIAGTSATASGAAHIVPSMANDHAYVAPFAQKVKQTTGKPVFVAGRINQPQIAEEVLASGAADMCGMTRAMIADPEMPNKAKAGRPDDIRACIGCNQACIGHFQLGLPISCIQHPETGRELRLCREAPC